MTENYKHTCDPRCFAPNGHAATQPWPRLPQHVGDGAYVPSFDPEYVLRPHVDHEEPDHAICDGCVVFDPRD